MKIGMIFPGQGSQFMGMAKSFYDKERIVQEFFEEASSCLEKNFTRLCFSSSERELTETINAQTSIFLVSASLYTYLKVHHNIVPSLVAGHSLGEYSAIFAAGGMNFPDALYLLSKRAYFMDEATKEHNGGMLAVVGIDPQLVIRICQQYDDPLHNERVAQVVNFNSPMQMVVSGTKQELELIKADIELYKGTAIPLKVAGAFHSRLMKNAEEKFSKYLIKVDFNRLSIPLVNNIEARIVQDSSDVKASLVKQTSSPILWWQGMQHFKDFDLIIEIGPGITFTRMLKRVWPEKNIISINEPVDVKKLVSFIETHNK